MREPNLFASVLVTSFLVAGFLGIAAVADSSSARQAVLKRSETTKSRMIAIKRRIRGPRIPLPIGPSYLYYDYPYYYSRGYYPTHIGGYIYYPRHYYSHGYYPGHARRCSPVLRSCAFKRARD